MHVFVSGASGHIGSALNPELQAAGHQVIALAAPTRRRGSWRPPARRFAAAGKALEGSGKPFVAPSAHLRCGQAASRAALARKTASSRAAPWLARRGATIALAGLGVRASVIRLSPVVHTLDAARLFRLALESVPAGSRLHGIAEEGLPGREFAEPSAATRACRRPASPPGTRSATSAHSQPRTIPPPAR